MVKWSQEASTPQKAIGTQRGSEVPRTLQPEPLLRSENHLQLPARSQVCGGRGSRKGRQHFRKQRGRWPPPVFPHQPMDKANSQWAWGSSSLWPGASSQILCPCPKILHFSEIADPGIDPDIDPLWMTPPSIHWYGFTLGKERQIGFLFSTTYDRLLWRPGAPCWSSCDGSMANVCHECRWWVSALIFGIYNPYLLDPRKVFQTTYRC